MRASQRNVITVEIGLRNALRDGRGSQCASFRSFHLEGSRKKLRVRSVTSCRIYSRSHSDFEALQSGLTYCYLLEIVRTYNHKQAVAVEADRLYKISMDSKAGEGQVLGRRLREDRHGSSINDPSQDTALILVSEGVGIGVT